MYILSGAWTLLYLAQLYSGIISKRLHCWNPEQLCRAWGEGEEASWDMWTNKVSSCFKTQQEREMEKEKHKRGTGTVVRYMFVLHPTCMYISYLDFIVLKENIGLEVVDSLVNDVWINAWNGKRRSINTSTQCIWITVPLPPVNVCISSWSYSAVTSCFGHAGLFFFVLQGPIF